MSRFRTPIHRELNRGLRDIVGADSASELARLGLFTLGDLLRHVPRRYLSGTEMSDFRTLRPGEDVAVVARVVATRIVDGRTTRGATVLTHLLVIIDEFGAITGRKATAKATMVKVIQRARLVGLYPATAKMVTWKIADAIALALPHVLPLGDTLPGWVVERAGVIGLPDALREVHEPVNVFDAKRGIARLKFDEAFGMQLAMAARRAALAGRTTTPRPRRDDGILSAFDASLPYRLTAGQEEVGETLFEELASERPMHRLLQGEVGSGKTLVALRAMLAVVDAGGQAALLAPTEVLAKQHHASITSLLGGLGVAGTLEAHPHATQVALLTGGLTAANRRRARETVASGEAGIVIGTHALLSEDVGFADLGFVVVDEQHRFGVEQRAALAAKSEHQPHTLVMTATPIPRTIAMTFFGDLNHSTLSELPGGRRPIKSYVVPEYLPKYTTRAYEVMREHIHQGHQIYIVCPRINGPGGVLETHQHLSETEFKNYRIGLLHGQLKDADKDTIMRQFTNGDLDILIATTVIEVGIDVPNATIIMIRESENLGVSQLHQLRGRVGRGGHDSICFFHHTAERDTPADKRIWQMAATTDGFQVADIDLIQRHEGDVLGTSQSGTNKKIAFLNLARDIGLINRANRDAKNIVAHNLDLARQLIAGIDDITQDYLDKS